MTAKELIADLVKAKMREIDHFSLGGKSPEQQRDYDLLAEWLAAAERVPLQPSPAIEVAHILTNVCQILDVVKIEWGKAWSEWDQSVRDSASNWLQKFYALAEAGSIPQPQPDVRQQRMADEAFSRARAIRLADAGSIPQPQTTTEKCPTCGLHNLTNVNPYYKFNPWDCRDTWHQSEGSSGVPLQKADCSIAEQFIDSLPARETFPIDRTETIEMLGKFVAWLNRSPVSMQAMNIGLRGALTDENKEKEQ